VKGTPRPAPVPQHQAASAAAAAAAAAAAPAPAPIAPEGEFWKTSLGDSRAAGQLSELVSKSRTG